MTAAVSRAQSHSMSPMWSQAAVLSPGQRVFNVSTSFVHFSERFRSEGGVTPLGKPYAQKLTWLDLLSSNGAPENLELQEYLTSHGVNLTDVAAVTDVQISQDLWQIVPEGAYGLTARWTFGFRLPLFYRQTNVKTQLLLVDELPAEATSDGLSSLSSENLKFRSSQALQNRLNEMNYESSETPEGEWLIGDVELLSKYSLYKNTDLAFSWRQRLSLPTSSSPNPYRYIEISPTDGQLDVGVDAIVDYWIGAGWSVTGLTGYTWQAPDQVRMRLPVGERASNETQDLDYEVERALGDYLTADLYLEKQTYGSFKGFAGYQYYLKFRDVFSGSTFSKERYQVLNQNTEREQHNGLLGLSYSSDPFSENFGLRHQFVTRIFVSRVFLGKNVPATTTAGLDLQFYF